jgi:hypothetical protein
VLNKLLALCIIPLAMPLSAHAQIVPNNSYAQVLVNSNALLQNSISQTIASQAQTQRLGNSSGATPSTWCSPMPPADLQRGMDGHVPPQLQSDPRYQEWLHCQNRQNTPQANARTQAPGGPSASGWSSGPSGMPAYANVQGSSYPTPVVAHHLPMTATDFTPALPGHPFIEQYLQSQPLTNEQRAALRQAFGEMSSRIAKDVRPNNLAAALATAVCGAIYLIDNRFTDADSERYYVTINDRLGAAPEIAALSPMQKQNLADAWILQITVAKLLADLGQSNPPARAQSVQVAQAMLLQLTGSPTGKLVY